MSTSPQPPRPPIPPQAPRSSSNIVAIALLILALIVLVSGIAVWTGLKFLSHNIRLQVEPRGASDKQVSISTPVGSLEVHHDVNEASLNLPIYPGATRMKDNDSATVDLAFGSEQSVHVLAAKFQTPDSLESVTTFYKERLGSQVNKFTEKNAGRKVVLEMKSPGQEKVVTLEVAGSKTLITLVHVSFGEGESN